MFAHRRHYSKPDAMPSGPNEFDYDDI